MHIKGLEMPAYLPSGKTLGQILGYLTNPRGACHLSTPTAVDELTLFAPLEPNDIKGKPEMIAFLESLSNVMDSMGMCRFTAYSFIKKKFQMPHKIESKIFRKFPNFGLSSSDINTYCDLLSKATGKKYSRKKILEIGKNISKMEHSFNDEAGYRFEEETLPKNLLKSLTEDGDFVKGNALLRAMRYKYLKLRK